jgi:hypothetical protein
MNVRHTISNFLNEELDGDSTLQMLEITDENNIITDQYYYKFDDITQGRGITPITAVNICDHDPFPNITYIANFNNTPLGEGAEALVEGGACTGCQCENDCDDGNCSCCQLQIQSHSFYTAEGLLKEPLRDGTLIYECNSLCACLGNGLCINRVVQYGSKIPFQIFKTEQKGWGVKTLAPIRANQFIEEYLGEIVTEIVAEERGKKYDLRGCSYLFDLGHDADNNFTIDADHFCNTTRFFNHSCDPNMGSAKVCVDVQDMNTSRIAFFALRDIKAGEELEFDYKYQIQKRIRCYCGKLNCKKWVQ